MWLASSNGDHHTDITSSEIDSMLQRFLAHFVKGEDNGSSVSRTYACCRRCEQFALATRSRRSSRP